MDSTLIVGLIGLIGSVIGYMSGKYASKIDRLEAKIVALKEEIQARQCEEDVACEWISSLTESSEASIKLTLRDDTEAKCGLRPSLTPSKVRL